MFKLADQNILIISPHMDDEVIGCGGTIQRVKKAGSTIHVAIMSAMSEDYVKRENEEYRTYDGKDRTREMEEASECIGIDNYECLYEGERYHHRLDTVPRKELVRNIEEVVDRVRPTALLFPTRSYDQDHQATYDAMITVCRPHFFKGDVLIYETTGNQSFEPNLYIDIENELDTKLKACACYETQLVEDVHGFSLSSVKLRAEFRGREAFLQAAEAFQIYRMVER